MTLVTIWGNRTVDAVAAPNQPVVVGGLTREVFRVPLVFRLSLENL